ncbi:MAG: hypothetical protein ACJAS9_003902 [Polaribacter sp.]|jgi:hypothetical protein
MYFIYKNEENMKILLFCIITTFVWLLYVPTSQSANLAENICGYIAVDDKGRLRKLLKSNRLKLRKVFQDTSCNNDNLLIFAARQNANEVGQLLIKKLPKKVVANDLENLATLSPELTAFAKARIN